MLNLNAYSFKTVIHDLVLVVLAEKGLIDHTKCRCAGSLSVITLTCNLGKDMLTYLRSYIVTQMH